MYTAYGTHNTVVWDGKRDKALARFKRGVFETDNLDIARRLVELGYKVEGLPAAPPTEEDIRGWSADELKAYAQQQGIDIGKATSVEGLLAKITEAGKLPAQ